MVFDWEMGCLRFLLFSILLSACSSDDKQRLTSSQAPVSQVVAEGSAAIDSEGKDQARRDAIDAAVVEASEQMRTGNSQATLMSDIKVVDEWLDGNVYHVQILAVLSEKQSCDTTYRKKIVATAFPIMNAGQLSNTESQDLFGGIPREIMNRLMESGNFIGHNATNIVLYTRPDIAPDILPISGYSGSPVVNTARVYGAGLVLSGVIRDFKIESAEYLRGSGVLAEIKAAVRDMVGRRSIGIDVFVYDGLTGALLFQHRYTDSILGDVSLPAGYTVGSERFSETTSGHAIDNIVQKASDDLQQFFICYPFSSRVLQADGEHIVIAAGAQDKVRIGDKFRVFPAIGGTDGKNVALPYSQGVLTITEVSTKTAQGILDSGGLAFRVRPGDWVKSAFRR